MVSLMGVATGAVAGSGGETHGGATNSPFKNISLKVVLDQAPTLQKNLRESEVRRLFLQVLEVSFYARKVEDQNISDLGSVAIESVTPAEMMLITQIRSGRIPLAFFSPQTGTIFVLEHLQFESMHERSILAHEFVHYLQAFFGKDATHNCDQWFRNEREAVRAQNQWFEVHAELNEPRPQPAPLTESCSVAEYVAPIRLSQSH